MSAVFKMSMSRIHSAKVIFMAWQASLLKSQKSEHSCQRCREYCICIMCDKIHDWLMVLYIHSNLLWLIRDVGEGGEWIPVSYPSHNETWPPRQQNNRMANTEASFNVLTVVGNKVTKWVSKDTTVESNSQQQEYPTLGDSSPHLSEGVAETTSATQILIEPTHEACRWKCLYSFCVITTAFFSSFFFSL